MIDPNWTESVVWRLGIALGIGLLIGLERERRKGAGPARAPAGIRTFTLVALTGGIGMAMGNATLFLVMTFLVGALVIVGYALSARKDPGLTTEVAMLLTFFLGALAQTEPALAAGLGVAVAILLVARSTMHRFVRDILTEQELHDGLLFAGAALVVLPLLPDRSVGPFGFLNPHHLWRLVVIVIGVQSLGYVAIRLTGSGAGLALSGFFSGFVSSSATIAAMGSKAAKQPNLVNAAAAGAALSTVSTIVQLAIVLWITNSEILLAMIWPLAFAGIAALAYGWLLSRSASQQSGVSDAQKGRPFDFKIAAIFALVVSAALFLSALANAYWGKGGIVIATSITGFADVHSAAFSVASLGVLGNLFSESPVIPILAAFSTNSVTKAVMAVWSGGGAFARRVIPGLIIVLAAAWLGWLFAPKG